MPAKQFPHRAPLFHRRTGRVTGSEINMGGLVNRAAFKRIAPLFAAAVPAEAPEPFERVDTVPAATPMQNLLSSLRSLSLIDASATDEADIVTQVTTAVGGLKSAIANLKSAITAAARQRAETLVDLAVRAGRIATKDTATRGFWIDALVRDESGAARRSMRSRSIRPSRASPWRIEPLLRFWFPVEAAGRL